MGRFELLIRSLRRRGVIETLRYVYHELAFDLKYHTDTKAEISTFNLAGQDINTFAAPCQGANPWVVRNCIEEVRKLGVEIPRATFLDIGAGKGRVMLLAAFSGFKRVIGVELDNSLCLIAERNFVTNRNKLKCGSYIICNEDAARYTPPEGLNVAFMYNPFGANLMRNVLSNLIAGWSKAATGKSPQPLYIIYVNPICAEVYDELGLVPLRSSVSEAFIYKIEQKVESE